MYLKVHVTCEFYVVLTPCHVRFLDNHPIWFPKSLWQWCQIQVNILSLWMTRSSPLPIGGRGSLIVCGWDYYTTHGVKRPQAKDVIFDAFSLLPMRKETKFWGYRWNCYPWGQVTTYQKWQYHANCEWEARLTGLYGSVVSLW